MSVNATDVYRKEAVVDPKTLQPILKKHLLEAMGVCLLPFPVIDLIGLTAIQLNLVRVLAKQYTVPFSQQTVKGLMTAVISAALPVGCTPAVASFAKLIPFVGQAFGVLTMPILAGASTYAVGKVFIQHFESGGTFLTFDPKQVQAYYQKMFAEGQEIANSTPLPIVTASQELPVASSEPAEESVSEPPVIESTLLNVAASEPSPEATTIPEPPSEKPEPPMTMTLPVPDDVTINAPLSEPIISELPSEPSALPEINTSFISSNVTVNEPLQKPISVADPLTEKLERLASKINNHTAIPSSETPSTQHSPKSKRYRKR